MRALAKTPVDRYGTAAEFGAAIAAAGMLDAAPEGRRAGTPATHGTGPPAQRLGRPVVLVGLCLALAACVAGWLVWREIDRGRVRETIIPQIERAADEEDYFGAFRLARQAEGTLGRDPRLAKLWPAFAIVVSLTSHPEGALVYRRPYTGADTTWELVGRTPLPGVRFARDAYRLRVEKTGFQATEDLRVFQFAGTVRPESTSVHYALDSAGRVPRGVVRVLAIEHDPILSTFDSRGRRDLGDYWLDRFEVTNREFGAFVDSGGYERGEFWTQPFIRDGRSVPWTEAIKSFRDQTGRPGPATWESGTFPEDRADFPVTGVSWYEAAAFAEFAGRSLPTIAHWRRAAGIQCSNYIVPLSNFSQKDLAPVGSHAGMGPFGVYDMAGNAREWCWNHDGSGSRYCLGGAWDEPSYMFVDMEARSPWDRSAGTGFRCARYDSGRVAPPDVWAAVPRPKGDLKSAAPAPALAFQAYRGFYSYDRTPLEPSVLARDSMEAWIRETVSYDAAYGGERITAYLFLPKHGRPPFQAALYFPGSSALLLRSSKHLELARIDYVIKSGRAVLYPVYKSTYERGDGLASDSPNTSANYRDHVLMWAKDACRSLDYLETRGDIDMQRVAYLGVSWGAVIGPIISTVEPRISANIYVGGGLKTVRSRPEVDPLHFLPRVTQPTLMLNGRYDFYFPAETSQRAMFNLLGTPPAMKRHVLTDAAHSVPRMVLAREVLGFLDQYLGPVK